MPEYEFRFRFRSEANLRADYKEEDVQRVVTPFVFPRSKEPVTFIGCTVMRIDHRTDTVSESPVKT